MNRPANIRPNGYYKARPEGVISGTIAAGETKELDFIMPYDRIVDDADYLCSGFNKSDRISFRVIHPVSGEVLDEFAKRLFVRGVYQKKLYGARLPIGVIVRVIYENNGSSDASFNLNLNLHEVV